jgi:hypothetical protein
MRLTAGVGFPAKPSPRTSLPHSRHRPVAVTEGSLIENLNKIAVRLWTGCSFDENGEVGCRDALDPVADEPNRLTGPNQRRSAVLHARELWRSSVGALDLEQQRREMGRPFEHLTRPAVERPARIEDDLDAGSLRCRDCRNLEDITFDGGGPARAPSQTAIERARTIDRNSCSNCSRTLRRSRAALKPQAIVVNNPAVLRARRMCSDSAGAA